MSHSPRRSPHRRTGRLAFGMLLFALAALAALPGGGYGDPAHATPDEDGETTALSSTVVLSLPQGLTAAVWSVESRAASEVAAAADGELRAIYGWDADARAWTRYLPSAPDYVNTLDTLVQGQAYWFVADAPLTITP